MSGSFIRRSGPRVLEAGGAATAPGIQEAVMAGWTADQLPSMTGQTVVITGGGGGSGW
ncbi:hypothetical protein Asp14428_16540 [Actinoplanes sp. NBRC 14428]|nr:hypothetical protein Asp14428_16540 [Actinoplanes sp. NBRC 14428]